jgi:flagellin FlaB
VAAIAAGVLINTAGFLQSQAESTGQESTDQVSNNIQVAAVSGNVNSGTVDSVDLSVQLAPGSDPINASAIEVSATGDASGTFTFEEINGGGSGLDTTLTEEDGIISADISSQLGGSLDAGDQVELLFTTPSGAQTQTVITVPDPLGNSDSVTL